MYAFLTLRGRIHRRGAWQLISIVSRQCGQAWGYTLDAENPTIRYTEPWLPANAAFDDLGRYPDYAKLSEPPFPGFSVAVLRHRHRSCEDLRNNDSSYRWDSHQRLVDCHTERGQTAIHSYRRN